MLAREVVGLFVEGIGEEGESLTLNPEETARANRYDSGIRLYWVIIIITSCYGPHRIGLGYLELITSMTIAITATAKNIMTPTWNPWEPMVRSNRQAREKEKGASKMEMNWSLQS